MKVTANSIIVLHRKGTPPLRRLNESGDQFCCCFASQRNATSKRTYMKLAAIPHRKETPPSLELHEIGNRFYYCLALQRNTTS